MNEKSITGPDLEQQPKQSPEQKEEGFRYSEAEIEKILAQGGVIKVHHKNTRLDIIPLHLHTIEVKDGVINGFWTKHPDDPNGKFEIQLKDIESIEQE